MLINDNPKFIFIHIPKNSGTAMSENLLKVYKQAKQLKWVDPSNGLDKMHLYYNVQNKYIPKEIINTSFKFCIVRNPYTKLCSAYYYLKNRFKYQNINDFVKNHLDEDFIFGRELEKNDARVHFRPQYTFVYDKFLEKRVDFVIKYENLNEDIEYINEKFGLKIPCYGEENKYNDLDIIKNLDRDSIKIINNLYARDFEYFNYEKI